MKDNEYTPNGDEVFEFFDDFNENKLNYH
ncbi:MAG: hypothetical protein GXN95_05005 [Methanococci archaeon]|nr:hypothetical protein [Methanococci archaeon]